MTRLLSYIYPVTRKGDSDHGGILAITWYDGTKSSRPKKRNSATGALERASQLGSTEAGLTDLGSVLLLGLGGGSVIETLRNDFDYKKSVVAVDIDEKIIDIARNEFNLKDDKHLEIHCRDAFTFMQNNSRKFDLIIIDLFIDTEV